MRTRDPRRAVPVMNTQLPAKKQSHSPRPVQLAEPSKQTSTKHRRHGHPVEAHPSVDVSPPEELERCFVIGYN